MNNVHFNSFLAEDMRLFVDFKRVQSYDYSYRAHLLNYFDRFLTTPVLPLQSDRTQRPAGCVSTTQTGSFAATSLLPYAHRSDSGHRTAHRRSVEP